MTADNLPRFQDQLRWETWLGGGLLLGLALILGYSFGVPAELLQVLVLAFGMGGVVFALLRQTGEMRLQRHVLEPSFQATAQRQETLEHERTTQAKYAKEQSESLVLAAYLTAIHTVVQSFEEDSIEKERLARNAQVVVGYLCRRLQQLPGLELELLSRSVVIRNRLENIQKDLHNAVQAFSDQSPANFQQMQNLLEGWADDFFLILPQIPLPDDAYIQNLMKRFTNLIGGEVNRRVREAEDVESAWDRWMEELFLFDRDLKAVIQRVQASHEE